MRRATARALTVALAVFAGLPLAAAATLIVPVSQTRSVSVFAQVSAPGGVPSSSSFSASDFGTFDQTASATSTYAPAWYISNSVRQKSTIGDTSITAELSGSLSWGSFGGGTTDSHSVFDVTFDLTAPATYKLGNGQVAYQFGYGTHTVTLRDANGNVIAQPAYGFYPPGSTDLLAWTSVSSGVLQPGRYRLTAQWDRNLLPGDPGQWNAAAVLNLVLIPEPATALLVALGLGTLAVRRERAFVR